ncbi:type III secretion protein HrpD [Klebsiella michiganensis]|nr:type III secretion protein HrpD [Klebsiella michiganensis]
MVTWDRALTANWLRWWLEGFWRQADASWFGLPWFSLDEARRQSLMLKSPQALPAMLVLEECLPETPDTRLLALVTLDLAQRETLFALVAEVCQRGSGAGQLTEPQRVWCERLTRGLRPGVWLPASLSFSEEPNLAVLCLLRPIITPAAWQRLRFSFPQAVIARCEAMLVDETVPPLNRLQALWDGAIWQAQQPRTPALNDFSREQ